MQRKACYCVRRGVVRELEKWWSFEPVRRLGAEGGAKHRFDDADSFLGLPVCLLMREQLKVVARFLVLGRGLSRTPTSRWSRGRRQSYREALGT